MQRYTLKSDAHLIWTKYTTDCVIETKINNDLTATPREGKSKNSSVTECQESQELSEYIIWH